MTIHVSHQHRKLVLPYRDDLANLMPHATRILFDGEDMLAVPHGNDETRLMRNLGIDAPAPIVEHYEWPGNRKPFAQQVKTAAMLTMNPRAFVLNQMGTGKTMAVLWAFDWLQKCGSGHKMLVVAPLSTLRFVWLREAMLTLQSKKIIVLDGPKERRLKRLAEDADIYIINHDGVKTLHRELCAKRDIDVVVVDECGAFRNARSDRSKAMMRVLDNGRAFGWGLTGSPTPTSPTDAYGLAQLITPKTAPRSFSHFRNAVMLQAGTFKWLPRKEAAEIVTATLQPSVCFTLEDTIELPQLIERPFDVEQGARQKAIYKELQNKAAALLKEGQLTAVNGGVVLSKLLQISSGYVYLDDGTAASLDNDLRLEALVELIDGAREKVIVFAPFTHTVHGIEKHLAKEGLDFALVTGATPSWQRDEIFNAFQRTSQYDVLLAHPQCMAHGLTLTAADTIVWFSPITSLEIFSQANARIRRVGQTRKQQIFMMQGTATERRVYARLRQNRDMQDNILDLIKELTL